MTSDQLVPPVGAITTQAGPNPLGHVASAYPSDQHGGRASIAASALSRVKTYFWRVSATYLWVTAVMAVAGQFDVVQKLDRSVSSAAVRGLISVGFEPVNRLLLLRIAKLAWLFLITGFRVFELMGFALYVLFFPFVLLGLLAFRLLRKHQSVPDVSSEQRKVTALRLRPLTTSVLGLFSWFLLWGDAYTRRPLALGLLFAITTFALLFVRAFRRTKPIAEEDAAVLIRVEDFGYKVLSLCGAVKPPSTRAEAAFHLYVTSPFLGFYRRLAVFTRGRRGRDRVSLYVLVEYVVSLLLLGTAAILVWALTLKIALYPTRVSLYSALLVIAVHFVPGNVLSHYRLGLASVARCGTRGHSVHSFRTVFGTGGLGVA